MFTREGTTGFAGFFHMADFRVQIDTSKYHINIFHSIFSFSNWKLTAPPPLPHTPVGVFFFSANTNEHSEQRQQVHVVSGKPLLH